MVPREKKKTQAPEVLTGWKNISRHLGMGVRTIQRYERQMGLPIRRPARKIRGAVLATKSELDAWVAASPIRESFHLAIRSAPSPSNKMDAIKRGVEEMRVLTEQMIALRSELRGSMRSLRESVLMLRSDLWPGNWETLPFSGLDREPQSQRLVRVIPAEVKGRKAS